MIPLVKDWQTRPLASVYAFGLLLRRQDRYHRVGFTIAFSVAAIAMPLQLFVGDVVARWVYENEPTKFAAIELASDSTMNSRVQPNTAAWFRFNAQQGQRC